MPTAGRQYRQYTKEAFDRMASGGSLVSDQEKQESRDAMSSAATSAISAQQTALNRAAMSAGAGAPVLSGAMKEGAQQSAAEAANAAVKAAGTTEINAAALAERRKAAAMAAQQHLMAQNREDFDRGVEIAGRVTEAAGSIGSMFALGV